MKKILSLIFCILPLMAISAEEGYVLSLLTNYYLQYPDGTTKELTTRTTASGKIELSRDECVDWIKTKINETKHEHLVSAPDSTKITQINYAMQSLRVVCKNGEFESYITENWFFGSATVNADGEVVY